jgi:hypothetical protein
MHITVEDDVVAELDARVGPRRRSGFVVEALRRALADERRWSELESAVGALGDQAHDWDDNPAAWVRAQRAADPSRHG